MADPKRAVASIFNSAVAAAAIGAAWEVGFLDAVREHKKVDVHEFATQHDLDGGSMQGLVAALSVAHVIERTHDEGTEGVVVAGELLDDAYRNKSLFHWLALGSGGLFSRMQYALRTENRSKDDLYQRDAVAISHACHDINHEHFDPFFWRAVDGLEFQPRCVVDLGSGSGERLMQLLDRYPSSSAVGIDLARPSIQVAAAEARRRGLGGRLTFVEGDVLELQYRDDFAPVELLTCFMMGHDFWPRDKCVATLQRLRSAFPNVRRFLLGDTPRVLLDCADSKHAVTEDNVPVFVLGFEFGHALMGTYIPTVEEWDGVFAEGGWRCVKKHLVESSYLSVIFELERA